MKPKYHYEQIKNKIIDVIEKDYGYLVFYMCGDPKGVKKKSEDLSCYEKEEIMEILKNYANYQS